MSTNSIPAAASTEPTLNPMQLAGHTGFSSIPNDVLKLIYPRLDDLSKVMFEKTCRRLRGVGASVRKGVRIFQTREDFLKTVIKNKYLSVLLASLKPGKEFLASKPKFVSVVSQGESLTLDKLFYEAARVGDLEALKIIYFSNPEIIERMWVARLFAYTAASGNEEAKTWLRTKGVKFKGESITFAELGHVDVRPLCQERCAWDASTFTEAVKTGNLQLLQWLYEEKCPWNAYTFTQAVKMGNLQILQFLQEKGCPKDAWTFAAAAERGDLQFLQWLYEEKCPWTAYTFTQAVKTGNWEVLNWLQKKGCPKDEWTFAVAAEAGNLNVLKWLLKNGCPYHPETYNEVANKLF